MRPEEHAEKRNFVESILRVIPGFRGYLEKGYRREADSMVRDAIAERLQRAKPGLDAYAHQLLDGGHLDALPLVDRVRVALDTAISQVKGQVRGYSGFFDYVKVTEQTLDAVYEFDLRMVDEAEQLAAAVEHLVVKAGAPAAAMADLHGRIATFDRQFEGRAEILRGMAGGG